MHLARWGAINVEMAERTARVPGAISWQEILPSPLRPWGGLVSGLG